MNLANDRIHLLCAADRAYGPWLGVMVASVLGIDHGLPVTIHVLSDGIAERDRDRLTRLCAARGAALEIYDLSRLLAEEAGDFFVSLHISRTAYARIFFDRVIDPEIQRLLYLDCDTACIGSLRELWETDLGAAVVAAVPDLSAGTPEGRRIFNEPLGAPLDQPYYNSGVLLIDVARWRGDAIGAQLSALVAQLGSRMKWWDQDALNALLGPKIYPLEPKWNFQAPRNAMLDGSEAIIHYCGQHKPWHLNNGHRLASHYLCVKRASAWRWTPRFPLKFKGLQRSYRKRLSRLKSLFTRRSVSTTTAR